MPELTAWPGTLTSPTTATSTPQNINNVTTYTSSSSDLARYVTFYTTVDSMYVININNIVLMEFVPVFTSDRKIDVKNSSFNLYLSGNTNVIRVSYRDGIQIQNIMQCTKYGLYREGEKIYTTVDKFSYSNLINKSIKTVTDLSFFSNLTPNPQNPNIWSYTITKKPTEAPSGNDAGTTSGETTTEDNVTNPTESGVGDDQDEGSGAGGSGNSTLRKYNIKRVLFRIINNSTENVECFTPSAIQVKLEINSSILNGVPYIIESSVRINESNLNTNSERHVICKDLTSNPLQIYDSFNVKLHSNIEYELNRQYSDEIHSDLFIKTENFNSNDWHVYDTSILNDSCPIINTAEIIIHNNDMNSNARQGINLPTDTQFENLDLVIGVVLNTKGN